MTGRDEDDKKAQGIKMEYGGVEGHSMRFDEARRKVIDKFEDSKPVDQARYRMQVPEGSSEAMTQLHKLHPLVAGQRSPKKALFKLYVKLIAEANIRDPLTPEETRKLRRDLVLAEPTEDAAQTLIDRYC